MRPEFIEGYKQQDKLECCGNCKYIDMNEFRFVCTNHNYTVYCTGVCPEFLNFYRNLRD